VNQKQNKIIALIFLVVLIAMSFFKDNFTPDYLNSPEAFFLNPINHLSRISTLQTHYQFWLMSFLYSLIFIIFPFCIIHLYFGNKTLSRFVMIILMVIFALIYLMIFANSSILDKAIIPKINRYFHSPIIVFFFVAAFTLTRSGNEKK
jgi:general stress protein CsbA